MVEELLPICGKLLDYLNDSVDLDREKREYILNVIRRSIFILLLETRKN